MYRLTFIIVGSGYSAAVGVFENEFVGARAAFLEAVNDLNVRRDMRIGYTLLADVFTTPHDDSFTAAKKG